MSKKNYQKPAFQIIELSNKVQLLQTSDPPEPSHYLPHLDVHVTKNIWHNLLDGIDFSKR